MSFDYIEDAQDSLEKAHSTAGVNFIMIAGSPGNPNCWKCARVETLDQLEWYERRFSELTSKLRSSLTK